MPRCQPASPAPSSDAHGAGSSHEVNTNGRYVALGVCIVRKPQQQTRLSYSRVTDEEELEKIIVSAWILRSANFESFTKHDAWLFPCESLLSPMQQHIRKMSRPW